MDAITRIKIQKQPKKDFLKETLDGVNKQMNPIEPVQTVQPPLKQSQTAPTNPQPNNTQVVEQTPVATPKVAENSLNQANEQADLQSINNPTAQQINENNLIAGAKPKEGVPADYVRPSPVDFGAKLTTENAQQIMQEKGLQGLWDAINKDSAYEGQDEIDKREKREKQRNLITSIADGLSSIANIGGTLAGGVAQKQTSLSEANMKRREYQRQLREKDKDKWQAMMMRTGEQQMNYELAKDRQSLLNETQQSNLRVKEMELALKSQTAQGNIDKIYSNIADEKEEQKRKWSEYNLKVNQFNEQVKKNNWQKDVGYIKAGASATSAGASQQRANDNTTKTKAELEMRANGTWNQKSATGSSSQNKYTSGGTPPPPATPPKQPVKQSAPTKNTSSLGKYGFNSDNKKHKQDPFK